MLPTPDECREKAADELNTDGTNPDWIRARALKAIGWVKLADSIERSRED